jgi:hypothetical protein
MPIKVRVGGTYRLPNVQFESRTLEIEFSSAEWGISEEEVARDPAGVTGRLIYLGERELLKTLIAKGRYRVEEAKDILGRIAKAHGFVEVPAEETEHYLPPLDVIAGAAMTRPAANGDAHEHANGVAAVRTA